VLGQNYHSFAANFLRFFEGGGTREDNVKETNDRYTKKADSGSGDLDSDRGPYEADGTFFQG
jgi:hypothetical protein